MALEIIFDEKYDGHGNPYVPRGYNTIQRISVIEIQGVGYSLKNPFAVVVAKSADEHFCATHQRLPEFSWFPLGDTTYHGYGPTLEEAVQNLMGSFISLIKNGSERYDMCYIRSLFNEESASQESVNK